MRFSHRWRMERVAAELKATNTEKTASESGGFFMPGFFNTLTERTCQRQLRSGSRWHNKENTDDSAQYR
ncbi:protein of unknown function [Pararobbsia alpina]